FEETYIKFYYKHSYTNTSIERITSTSPDLDYQFDEDYHQYASKRSRMNTNNLYEIQQYLNEPTISKKIKPLYW
ncbi:13491_t:CDS:1, partial [Cetraspora pellucida]